MQFNSYEFVFLFFPAFLLVYYTVGKRWHRQMIILSGVIFYATAGWKDAMVLAVSILVTEGAARGLVRAENERIRKTMVLVYTVLHGTALFLYKY